LLDSSNETACEHQDQDFEKKNSYCHSTGSPQKGSQYCFTTLFVHHISSSVTYDKHKLGCTPPSTTFSALLKKYYGESMRYCHKIYGTPIVWRRKNSLTLRFEQTLLMSMM